MVKGIIYSFVFLISIAMVIKGNTISGYNGIIIMLIGLAGLLTELYLYNRKYQ